MFSNAYNEFWWTLFFSSVDNILTQHSLCNIIPNLNCNSYRTTQTGKINVLGRKLKLAFDSINLNGCFGIGLVYGFDFWRLVFVLF